ncbi:Transcriptional regulator GntR family [Patulibacter medicamentivorans]|uniref:Transcriptional regulator GntR family n=1 Tax=Patulibacter medicamentivorans TaxID=1097667 RepID=H0E1L1_9ACTN|nr:FadR/GntR family transcriptional regulator [Patulibacter medicamentivorans]EHN12445.1 Transcriptional regulator GntR family [Patulibacter medicamentivorans]
MTLSSLGRSALSELAVEQLREHLAAGAWPVGARLPAEAELARQLDVGRSTVREAVRVLVHAGQLETRQGSGTYVRALVPPPEWEPRVRRAEVLEVYEVREALESQAARLAALRRTDDDLDRIDRTLQIRERTRAAGEVEPFVDADLAFHAAVVDAAHNVLLSEMFGSFLSVLRAALIEVVAGEVIDRIDSAGAHAALRDAIRARDPAGAVAATHDNVTVTARGLHPDTRSTDR